MKNNNSIDIDVIEIMLDDENLESEIDLIKGIQQEKCKHLKKNKKINVFNSTSHDKRDMRLPTCFPEEYSKGITSVKNFSI